MLSINLKNSKIAPTCECGCGLPVERYKQTSAKDKSVKGDWARFLRGHSSRFVYKNNRSRIETVKYQIELANAAKYAALQHYSNGTPKCACCGETGLPFLTLDHIIPIRKSMKRKDGGGKNLCLRLKRRGFPEGFQVLCWNCNCAKGVDKQCPHQKASI